MFCPSDGLDYQQEVLIKAKKMKNSNSKVVKSLLSYLDCGKHSHMLKYIGRDKTRFKVRLINKKSRNWTEKDISLFKDLDLLSKKNFESKDGKNYEEKCKVRFKARMVKLKKYFKEEKTCQTSTVEKWKHYKILKRPVVGGEGSSYTKENLTPEIKKETMIESYEKSSAMDKLHGNNSNETYTSSISGSDQIEDYETSSLSAMDILNEINSNAKFKSDLSGYHKIESCETSCALDILHETNSNANSKSDLSGYDQMSTDEVNVVDENNVCSNENVMLSIVSNVGSSLCAMSIAFETNRNAKYKSGLSGYYQISTDEVNAVDENNVCSNKNVMLSNYSFDTNIHEMKANYSDDASIFEDLEEKNMDSDSNAYLEDDWINQFQQLDPKTLEYLDSA